MGPRPRQREDWGGWSMGPEALASGRIVGRMEHRARGPGSGGQWAKHRGLWLWAGSFRSSEGCGGPIHVGFGE